MPLAMNREVFITCAVTGSGGTQDRSPHVPRSPKQIADSAIAEMDGINDGLHSYGDVYQGGTNSVIEPCADSETPRWVGGYGFGYTGDKAFVSAAVHQEIGEVVDIRASYCKYDFQNSQNRVSVGMSLNLGVCLIPLDIIVTGDSSVPSIAL
jgi:hypothetical protein